MSKRWYVVHTKARQELLAAGLLEQHQAVTVLLPQVRQRTRGQMRVAPLFPGYLFVELDLEQVEASAVNNTPGVVRLVAFGGVPKPVPGRVIEALQARLAELDAQGGLPQHPFRAGDRVRLKEGAGGGLRRPHAAGRAGAGAAGVPGPGAGGAGAGGRPGGGRRPGQAPPPHARQGAGDPGRIGPSRQCST